jgi:saccharopine dehydrogenase (NAD+, L-lysine-forming)
VTLPRFLPAIKRVTNKGTVLPDEYYDLTMNLCRMGFTSKEPVKVGDVEVTPYDFGIAYILRERENILKQTNFGEQRGCVKIVVNGKKDGRPHSFVFSIASTNQALGEGTGIPAAMGTVLMLQGKIKGTGILPPEACIEPMDFLMLMQQILGLGEGSGKSSPLTIESIDADGNIEKIEF